MSFGSGYFWHSLFKFPDFPKITKTLTLEPRTGRPWAIMHLGKSIWNYMGLPNKGFTNWLNYYYRSDVIVSIAGVDDEIKYMCSKLDEVNIKGVELNFSCPNVKDHNNKLIPKTKHKLFLKLNYKQNPFDYDLNRIEKISVNSVPIFKGAISGRGAQKNNWVFVENCLKNKLPVSGCSWVSLKDLNYLVNLGCKYIDIGTVLLINPWLVQRLGKHDTREA